MLFFSHLHFLNLIQHFGFLWEGERSSNEYLYVFNRCLKTKREAVSMSAFFIAVCHVVQVKLAKLIFSFQKTNIASRGEQGQKNDEKVNHAPLWTGNVGKSLFDLTVSSIFCYILVGLNNVYILLSFGL